jgi:large subunit ribosomal protein L17
MNNRKLGRTADQRKAMLRNLATDVIVYGKINTTYTRAKETQAVVDSLITLAKKGDLAARREAASYVRNVKCADGKTAVQKLFDELGPKYKDRNGGYTRVIKTEDRRGDASTMAFIELI